MESANATGIIVPMPPGSRRSKRWTWITVALLLLVMLTEIALSTRQSSASWDEGDHIFSGYMNWKHGEYSFNPEHPPLVKLIATLPLLPLVLKIAPRQGRGFKDEAYYGGRELLFRNDPRYGGLYTADTLLFRVHMAVSVFALSLALLLFFAGRAMFGVAAGLIAMALFVFDPTILTNAPFVTTDSAAACFFFASSYAFYRYVVAPSRARVVVCGLTFGLALVSKHSAVLLLPIVLLLAAGELVLPLSPEPRAALRERFASLAVAILAMASIAIFVLWGVYSFRYAMHPVGEVVDAFEPRAAALNPLLAHTLFFCWRYHLLPQSYLYGMVDVERVAQGMPSYIFGRLYAHGQWFYFPVELSLKWSVGVLGLLALFVYAVCRGYLRTQLRALYFLALPALFYLAVAMASPLNIGVRHVLPVFPFAFALAGAGAWALLKHDRRWLYPIAVLLLWHGVDSVRMFPNYMPYANTLWGGPAKTHLYLSDSATDWGQELKWTKQYLDAHGVHACWFAYFPAPYLLPSDYGIPCRLLPTADNGDLPSALPAVLHGPILISYADLNGFEYGSKIRNPYQSFFERKPDAVIANGIAVFNGDFSAPRLASFYALAQAQNLFDKGEGQRALVASLEALSLDPDSFDGHLAAADALHLLGRDREAREQDEAALALARTMEPSSRAEWETKIEQRLAALKL